VAQVGFFLALLFAVIIAIFAVQNTQPVSVSFLFWGPFNTVSSVLVLISAALGALAMLVLSLTREAGLRWRLRSLGQQLKQAQARIAQLEAAQPAASVSAPATATPAAVEAPTASVEP
jgi:lipopolysaccharide assembly protein A